MKETTKKSVLRWLTDIPIIMAGACCYAIGLHCFNVPNNIAAGGVGGIATIINYLTELDVGLMYGLINVPLVIIGLIFLGKKMMIKTAISVATVTFATDYLLKWVNMPVYENGDRLLATIFGGVLTGFGLGVIFLREGTSGGTDIINKLINKKFPYIRMGTITFATDAAVVIASVVAYGNIESGMYSMISIFVFAKVMDVILYGTYEGKMLLIFSDKYEEISQFIMDDMSRGVTLMDGKGAYSGQEKHIICCAVHKSEYAKIKRKVKEIDSKAFIIITNTGEVLGDGFQENI